MFGAALSVPVPDLDRTDYLLMLGANPFASNGSLMTAPDLPGRLARAARARRPARRRRPAPHARPPRRPTSTSSSGPAPTRCFLFALVHVLLRRGPRRPRLASRAHVDGVDDVRDAGARRSRPKRSRRCCGIDARHDPAPRARARDGAGAPRSTARIGTCTQEFGTLASWLVDVLNVLTGNLDRPGGAMFTQPATGSAQHRRHPGHGPRRARSAGAQPRARDCPSSSASSRSRASPRRSRRRATARSARSSRSPATRCVSTPDADRLDRALAHARLHGERRHLPQRDDAPRRRDPAAPARARARPLRPRALPLAIRNVANYSPPLVELDPGAMAGVGDPAAARRDRQRAGRRTPTSTRSTTSSLTGLVQKAVTRSGSNVEGRDADELLAALAPRRGPERVLDLMLRTGPYGDGFGADPDGLSLAVLEAQPARRRPRAAAAAPPRGAAHADRHDRARARR